MMRVALAFLIAGLIPSAAKAECTCLFAGGAVEHGQTACIQTAKGKQLARCEKVLNNSSWTFLDEACDVEQSHYVSEEDTTHG
jgi:hypothetical protein